jgi:DNA-binding LacI/PurR family transcriptional regulator
VAEVAAYVKAQHPRPTAVFGYDESTVQALAEQLPDTGLRVPEDVSIISYNSTGISERSHPPLTSVYQPLGDIGAEAVHMLAARIEMLAARGQKHDTLDSRIRIPERIKRLPVRLDIRVTTAPIREQKGEGS